MKTFGGILYCLLLFVALPIYAGSTLYQINKEDKLTTETTTQERKMEEYKFIDGPLTKVQTTLNQWKNDYVIVIKGFSITRESIMDPTMATILVTRQPKAEVKPRTEG